MNLSLISAAVIAMFGDAELPGRIGTCTNLIPARPSIAPRIPSGVSAQRTSPSPYAEATAPMSTSRYDWFIWLPVEPNVPLSMQTTVRLSGCSDESTGNTEEPRRLPSPSITVTRRSDASAIPSPMGVAWV